VSSSIVLVVDGIPQPQGSKTAYVVNGRAVIAEGTPKSRKKLKAWRAAVRAVGESFWLSLSGPAMFCGPVIVTTEFRVVRPKSVKRAMPTIKPDLDHYIRSVGDALTGVIWDDDSQIVEIRARKVYSPNPGATIIVTPYVADA